MNRKEEMEQRYAELLQWLDEGANYSGYPEGFGRSWPALCAKAASAIRVLQPAALRASAAPEEGMEAIAQWLHDETRHPDSYPDYTWPETDRDDGQREGGFVKIVPLHAQAYFRDIARRLIARFGSALPSDSGKAAPMAWLVQREETKEVVFFGQQATWAKERGATITPLYAALAPATEGGGRELPQRPHSIYGQYHLDNWTDYDFAKHTAATRKTLAWLLELEAALSPSPSVGTGTLNEWIDREFAGHGRAVRTKDEVAYPGEPYMSMADAKELTRRAVATFGGQ